MSKRLTMAEAGSRMGMSGRSAKRALRNAGLPLHVEGRGLVVDEGVLAAFLLSRLDYAGRGRPPSSEQEKPPDPLARIKAVIEALPTEQQEELRRWMDERVAGEE